MRRFFRLLLYRFSQFVAWFLFAVFYRIRRYGARNIPRPPFIVACNHQSFLDPIIVGFTCPHPVRYMARASLFHNPLFAALIRAYGAFEIERDAADLSALRKTMRFLKNGECVLLFPEGTRTRDGKVGQIKPGGFLIAARLGVAVVPAVIEGAFCAWRRNTKLPRFFLPIRIYYGKPIRVGVEDIKGVCADFGKRLESARCRLAKTMRKKYFGGSSLYEHQSKKTQEGDGAVPSERGGVGTRGGRDAEAGRN